MVLRFVSPRTATVAPPQTSLHSAGFKFFEPEKPRGPLRKNPLTLTISGGKGSFPLTKNLFFIGESEINDLMIKPSFLLLHLQATISHQRKPRLGKRSRERLLALGA